MGIGNGLCSLIINRRVLFSDGNIGLGRNQDEPCDHELYVMKFKDLSNKLIAVMISWPCHDTASGEDNYFITGDWPGSASRFIKNKVVRNVVVSVTASASADINPIYGPGSNFNEINATGFNDALETIKVLPALATYSVKSVQSVYTTI